MPSLSAPTTSSGVRREEGIALGLEQESHRRAVAMGQHQVVLGRQRRQRRGREGGIAALHLGAYRLAALGQCVPAQRNDDATHSSSDSARTCRGSARRTDGPVS